MSGRGPKFEPLPEWMIARAKAMRSAIVKRSWEAIAADLGVKVFRIRKSLDPGYSRAGPSARVQSLRKAGIVVVDIRPDIPEEIERERVRLLEYVPENLTALVMGDPPPWRSALAEKNRSQNVDRNMAPISA